MAHSHDVIAHLMQAAHGISDLSTPQALHAWSLATRKAGPYLAILPVLPLPAGTPRLPVFSELHPTDTSADPDAPQQDSAPTGPSCLPPKPRT
ncbi:hypothetical protein [Streptomyces sp. NPDC059918]|uniref:hypothetical protein n=1 Tax=unclassified Streptomyces TaxID=2593676 RepID=UPI0036631D64